MKAGEDAQLKRIVLASTPWPLYNRPSIQLGTLKAYLGAHFPGLQINVFHLYLKRIVERFPKVGEERILPFLKMMVDKRLMFEEKGRYLSLAVRVMR